MITVLLFLWDDPKTAWRSEYRYSFRFVSRSIEMVERNLSLPHRFVLVTDKPGIAEGVVPPYVNIKEIDNSLYLPGKRFQKLMAWRPDADTYFGDFYRADRILMMDLDNVIVDSLDPLVERDEDVVLWRNPSNSNRTHYNTSMVLLSAGARPHVWTEFNIKHSPPLIRSEHLSGTDQAWVSRCLGKGESVWENGVYSFRNDYLKPKITHIPGERVICFHGRMSPNSELVLREHSWIQEHYYGNLKKTEEKERKTSTVQQEERRASI